ncbi:MAG: GlsB/YeaQ/YmgE family stress response membrane protein [Actinomycetota bacterium]
MEWLYLILAGLVVGAVARLLMPGRDPIGILGTLLLGVVGALLGGYLWIEVLGFDNSKGIEFIAAVLTAILLLFIFRKMTYGRTSARRF